uniref:Uncharacterized protein n=1 Tax=Gasterosteus aculeatus aculeatus TaxID=481459 RepID=A0AAQ4NWW8_GASAC
MAKNISVFSGVRCYMIVCVCVCTQRDLLHFPVCPTCATVQGFVCLTDDKQASLPLRLTDRRTEKRTHTHTHTHTEKKH